MKPTRLPNKVPDANKDNREKEIQWNGTTWTLQKPIIQSIGERVDREAKFKPARFAPQIQIKEAEFYKFVDHSHVEKGWMFFRKPRLSVEGRLSPNT